MRLLLKLKFQGSFKYIPIYHKAQGFIYNLLRGTNYEILHNYKNYKYFCFSNIFPIGDIKDGDIRNFLISSPDKLFIKTIFEKISDISDKKIPVNIGEMKFIVEDIIKVNVSLRDKLDIISSTPIIVRIPERKYEIYNIPINFRKRRYVFWRPEYQIRSFVKQLEENLIKKYTRFYDKSISIDRIFQEMKLNKTVSTKVVINGKEMSFIGSIWEFSFDYLSPKVKKLLKFGIECGFGERNSFGFGFVNPVS